MAQAGDALTGLAIDIGGSKIAAARFQDGAIVARHRLATDGSLNVAAWIDTVGELLAELGDTSAEPVGVAVTGRVDGEGRWSAINTDTLSAVDGAPLADGLRRRFGPRVAAMNDALAAATGEAIYGAGQGASTMAYLTVSTGVGGGIVLGGRPLTSVDGLAGHVGFMTTQHGDAPCPSGRVGTLESVASGKAIEQAARAGGHEDTDAAGVFDHWRSGEDWAAVIVQRSADAIAEASANLKAALGLEIVVIGGSVGLAEGYLDLVRHALDREPPLFRVEVRPAALGADSPLLGALHMAREAVSEP